MGASFPARHLHALWHDFRPETSCKGGGERKGKPVSIAACPCFCALVWCFLLVLVFRSVPGRGTCCSLLPGNLFYLPSDLLGKFETNVLTDVKIEVSPAQWEGSVFKAKHHSNSVILNTCVPSSQTHK